MESFLLGFIIGSIIAAHVALYRIASRVKRLEENNDCFVDVFKEQIKFNQEQVKINRDLRS